MDLTKLNKRRGWHGALKGFLMPEIGLPFIWGIRDCHTLALGAVDAMAGTELRALIYGQYFSARGALALRKRIGKLSEKLQQFGAVVTSEMEFGDIVIIDRIADAINVMNWKTEAAAVALTQAQVVFPTDKGVSVVRRDAITNESYSLRVPVCRS